MNVGELFGTLGIDDRGWNRGLDNAGDQFDRFTDVVEDDLDGLERAFERETAAFLEEMERGFGELDDIVQQAFAAAEDEAAQGAEKITDEVKRGVDQGLEGAVDAARRQGDLIGDKLERGIEDGLDDAERSARQAGEEIGDEVGDGLESAAEDGGQRGGEGMMTALKGAGIAAAAVAAAAIGAALMAGIEEALQQEVSGDILAAQLDLTKEQAALAGQVAGELYVQAYGESMADVDEAVGAVMSSFHSLRDGSAEALEDVTAAALDFSKAFQVEVGRATQVAGVMFNDGLAKDGKHAFDLLAKASQRVPTAIREDLIDTVEEYGTFFRALGLNGEQTMGILVTASLKGKFGLDKMGDSLKEFILLSTDLGSSAVTDAYEEIGLDAEAMADALLSGGERAEEAFGKIVDGLSGIKDPSDQAATAIALFGTPLEDMNKADIPEFLASLQSMDDGLGDVAGAADKLGDTMADNAATKFESFKRGLEEKVVGFIGSSVLPALEDLVEGFRLSGVPERLAEIGGKAKELFDTVIADVRAWAAEHQEEIEAFVEATKGLLEGVADFVGAFIDLVKAIWSLFGEESLTQTTDTWTNIANFIEGTLDIITGILKTATGILTGDWQLAMDGMKQSTEGGMDQVSSIFDSTMSLVASTSGRNWDLTKMQASSTWEDMKSGAQSWGQSMIDAADWLKELPGKVAGYFWQMKDGAVQKAGELVDWVRGLPDRILGAIGDLGQLLLNAGRRVVQGFIDGIVEKFRVVRAKLAELTSMLPDWKGPANVDAKLLTANGRLIMQSLVDGFRDGEVGVERYLGDLTNRMGSMQYPGPSVDVNPYGASDPLDVTSPEGGRSGGPLVSIGTYNEAGNHDVRDTAEELYWLAQSGGG